MAPNPVITISREIKNVLGARQMFSMSKMWSRMVFLSLVRLCSRNQVANMTRILNVAEKNDAAKSLAEIMSRGNARRVSRNESIKQIPSKN